jgi:hypothetical protein
MKGCGIFHDAAAELDHREAVLKAADVAQRFDKRLSLAYGIFHRGETS